MFPFNPGHLAKAENRILSVMSHHRMKGVKAEVAGHTRRGRVLDADAPCRTGLVLGPRLHPIGDADWGSRIFVAIDFIARGMIGQRVARRRTSASVPSTLRPTLSPPIKADPQD